MRPPSAISLLRSPLHAVLPAAVFLLLFPLPVRAQNRVEEYENFHNSAYIRTDEGPAKAELFQAQEALRRGETGAAVDHLLRVLALESDLLVPFGPRTFLEVRGAAVRRIATLPAEVLALYRKRAEAGAARLLASAADPRHAETLSRVIRRYPLTPSARRSQEVLGEAAFERGEYLRAARRFHALLEEERLLKGTPFALEEGARARIRLSLYLSLRLAGEAEEAAPYRPEGPVELGGRRFEPEALERLLPPLDSGGPLAWPTRGGHPSRFRLPAFDAETLRNVWFRPLADAEAKQEGVEQKNGGAGFETSLDPLTRRYLEARSPLSPVFPVVADGVLYAFDDRALHALDLETGRPRFGPIRWDWSLLFGEGKPDVESVTYSGTLAGGVLYAALNQRKNESPEPKEHLGVLLALDLRREGYALWRRGGRAETDPRLKNTAFSGAPAVAGGRVFLLGTRYAASGEARAESVLFAFDARTGEILWDRFLCSGAEVDRFEIRLGSETRRFKDRLEAGAPVAESAGILYVLTNLGVAGAVDAFTGRILWLFKYNRVFSQDPDRYYREFFLDTGGWRRGLPLVRDGRLYFAPEDSRFFYCLALQPDPEGFIILDDPIEKGRKVSFIGTDGERFYFTAREGVKNYILATDGNGTVFWETPPFEREDPVTGRPLLTATALFVPTARYLYRLDLAEAGNLDQAFPLPAALRGEEGGGDGFGNLVAAGDYLVSVSRKYVMVFKRDG